MHQLSEDGTHIKASQSSATAMRASPWRVGLSSALVISPVYAVLGGMTVIYLPVRVSELGGEGREAALAVIGMIAAGLVIVTQPLIGALSDRTRSRLGRRLPWMLAGAVGAALIIPLLGLAPGVVILGAVAVLAEVFLNAVRGPVNAVLVDAVPLESRGSVSAWLMGGFLVGSLAGTAIVGPVAAESPGALTVAAIVVVIAVGVFGWLSQTLPQRATKGVWQSADSLRMHSTREADATHTRVDSQLATLVIPSEAASEAPPLRAFAAVFAARVLVYLPYSMVMGFVLYMIEELAELPQAEAVRLTSLLITAAFALAAPAAIIAGVVIDRTGARRRVAIVAVAAMALAFAAPLLVDGLAGLFVLAALFGVGVGAHSPADRVLGTLVVRRGPRTAGRDLGLLQIAINSAQFVAPGVAAIIIYSLGYEWMLLASSACAAAAAMVLVMTRSLGD